MQRTELAKKILVLGIDGFDPNFAKRVMEEGRMPNLKKFIERGACREDMEMIGGQPTLTPPMWTTMATGAYPYTHGITCFNRQSPNKLSAWQYNIDSRRCLAEPLWNVFAEVGKKTLVWHWPGSSWPPTSDSENLFVVDGSGPGTVAMGVAQVEENFVLLADEAYTGAKFLPKGETFVTDACVVTDVDLADEGATTNVSIKEILTASAKDTEVLILDVKTEGSNATTSAPLSLVHSQIKPATGWANAPVDAKEFTLLLSTGLISRPCLILKNEQGVYDTVAIYKNKKDTEPMAILPQFVMGKDIVDQAAVGDNTVLASRYMKLLEIEPDGSKLRFWVSAAMEVGVDSCYHPKSLHQEIVDAAGNPPPASYISSHDKVLVEEAMIDMWNSVKDWYVAAMNAVIDNHDIDVVFSHFHNVDMEAHKIMRYLKDKGENVLEEADYLEFLKKVYVQTDEYIGEFLYRLDEGWTIIITSDHGQACPVYNPPLMSDATGCTVGVMKDMGYTVLKKDENGNEIREIDWEKTTAVSNRANHIYINLKGRTKYGWVDPADQHELEERIITDLYSYKLPESGRRAIAVALRNKDAILLGIGGPESGDIIYWMDESCMTDHGESLSTAKGAENTSMASFFAAAGPGVKENFRTTRVIRQVDLAPTVAALGGVRMPRDCEGAPVYQILTEDF